MANEEKYAALKDSIKTTNIQTHQEMHNPVDRHDSKSSIRRLNTPNDRMHYIIHSILAYITNNKEVSDISNKTQFCVNPLMLNKLDHEQSC